jgi:hypothetical protein
MNTNSSCFDLLQRISTEKRECLFLIRWAMMPGDLLRIEESH